MPTLEWMGKNKVVTYHRQVPYRVLERIPEKSVLDSQGSDCGNMVIHGDNLEALKALLPEYEGKVDCIYIDPPYNTGNEGWVYNDNVNDPRIRKWIGEVVGKEGEDFSRHDKWLCMMYPRLQLLRNLLSEEGAIFISIDEIEYANLRCICDEIFGASNFRSRIVWQKRYTRSNNTVGFTTMTESILVYSKSASFTPNLLPRDQRADKRYTNPDNDPRGPWKGKSFLNPETPERRPTLCYWIENPNTMERTWPKEKAWRVAESTYRELASQNRLYWGRDGKNSIPSIKMFLADARGLTPVDLWDKDYAGTTDDGSHELENLFDGRKKVFDFPKPASLIRRILEHATSKNSIVLDSFAGSGTTAQAVLQKNEEDRGNRRFILIEMNDYADSITAERNRKVIGGYGDHEKIDSGFSYYELGPVLFDADGGLNADVSADEVRRYIWYSEAKAPYADMTAEHPYLLGVLGETVYYLAYEPDGETTLGPGLLRQLPRRGTPTVVYADRCVIDDDRLNELNVVFKQIPRQIARV